MKRVVSVSLGSSERDAETTAEFGGKVFKVERIGVNGSPAAAREILRQLDGKVDAFSLGGTDLYVYVKNKRYTLRQAAKIAAAAQKTPLVDGSGVKNTLERRVIPYL
ncbi:MAG: quinate 5-dehydrogenase, partial [Sporomusaceae bacterium]|nr:quinate 5-dehydrogenase [Sporomusaceae bacterium]